MTHSHLNVFIGPPGTGKSSKLLSIMEQEMAAGVKPNKIGFIAFTKQAAEVARSRAAERFGFNETQANERLVNFRTIHSLVFRQLAMRRDQVMQWSHYRELGKQIGFEFKGGKSLDGTNYGMEKADRMLFLEGVARVRKQALKDAWHDANEPDLPWFELEYLAKSLKTYKAGRGLSDFTDMLEDFCLRGSIPKLDVLFIDEAQDLSLLQWDVVSMVAAQSDRVYVAGDDDQAIYRWAGADVESFMGLGGKKTVLDKSYRIPLSVHQLDARILARMKRRTAKSWQPREELGMTKLVTAPEAVDMSKGTWLLLARNGYMLKELETLCRGQGYAYDSVGKNPLTSPAVKAAISWERMRKGGAISKPDAENVLRHISPARIPQKQRDDVAKLGAGATVVLNRAESPIWHQALDRIGSDDREFIIAAHKRGEMLKKPRIRISTIHTAKGAEADHVMLLTDMSQRTQVEMARNMDDECRVWHVAVTRTRESLHVVTPRNATNSFPVM